MVTTIRQTIVFKNSTPQLIYDMLMNAKVHTAFTGAPATISTKIGGTFSAYGGYSSGKNLELVPGKKIVQTWRASDWKKGVTSTTTFLFSKTKTGTKLTFTQTGVPVDDAADIKQGWIDFYWKPMREYLQKK